MDSLTHIVVGGLVGEAVLGKKIGNKAIMWGSIMGSLPDADVLFAPFLNPVDALFFHRGISHSLLAAIILTPVFGLIISKIERGRGIGLKEWICLAGYPWLAHLFMDFFNTYGTGFFEPFIDIRAAFDSMAIIDLFLLLPLAILFVWILFYRFQNSTRRILAWLGLGFIPLYIALSITNKEGIEQHVKDQLMEQDLKYNRLITTPVPLSNFIWGIVVENDSGYYVGHLSSFEREKVIDFGFLPRNAYLLDNFGKDQSIEKLKRFTKGFYCVEKDSLGVVWMHDLRYASLDYRNREAFVFSFGIIKAGKEIRITRSHPKRSINIKTVRKYIRREPVTIKQL